METIFPNSYYHHQGWFILLKMRPYHQCQPFLTNSSTAEMDSTLPENANCGCSAASLSSSSAQSYGQHNTFSEKLSSLTLNFVGDLTMELLCLHVTQNRPLSLN